MSDVEESFGGMHNKPVWVYELAGQSFRRLLEGYGGYMSPISLQPELTKGYHNIRTYTHSSAAEHEITIFKYNGAQYQAAECITETYTGNVDADGKDIITNTRHTCEEN
jgi:hypothetical protein